MNFYFVRANIIIKFNLFSNQFTKIRTYFTCEFPGEFNVLSIYATDPSFAKDFPLCSSAKHFSSFSATINVFYLFFYAKSSHYTGSNLFSTTIIALI